MEEQLIQTEQFKKSYVPPRNILRFFREQNVGSAVSGQKIYNAIAKIKRNMMQGRNTVEEVLCLSAQQDYTVFYRNCDDINVLSDIVVAHLTSIQMMRTWPYVLLMNTTYKTNKVDATNHAESEYSVLKLWLSTCHGDLDIVFLNIDSLVQNLGRVRVSVGEGDGHELLGVGVEGVAVDEVVIFYYRSISMFHIPLYKRFPYFHLSFH
ncbi:hypothetical protein M9H77_14477 [Catharanthus roseus]|uniref:Uncharacterized protein n=1 Tax=Catharanthus roseus TaxID=4058 RepID=A0ACC0BNE7_CATRO|nr:hypothetical protein M9H77_14477 [Catharanthus roseus]